MVSNSMAIPSSLVTSTGKDVMKEYNGLRRSESGKDLRKQATMRRSYSDNHLCYSINHVRITSAVQPKLKSSHSLGIFPFQISSSMIPNSLRTFLFDPETSKDMNVVDKDENGVEGSLETSEIEAEEEIKRANWVDRLLEIRSLWRKRQQDVNADGFGDVNENGESDDAENGCMVDYNLEEEGGGGEGSGGETKHDRETFSRLLSGVSWSDTKLFSKLAFLCNLAYVIPEIKGQHLKSSYGLNFVTSSLERKAEIASMKAKFDHDSTCVPVDSSVVDNSSSEKTEKLEQKRAIKSSVAYEIAASAASYAQSRAKGLLSRGSASHQDSYSEDLHRNEDQSDEEGESSSRVYNSEMAAYVAASTMTSVVAAGEKEKQQAARDLQSIHSSPCDWFICDDLSTYTRCFVIQGSDSLASWQANLLFEPTKFEDTDVLVHRGIYEAAKGIYEQFMPEIIEHLDKYGERAKLQFTGHSLGGSLSLLIDLMLLMRKVVKPSTLRPAVTFGAPFVFCGGHKILGDLGLDESHVHCVMMHRDIVPRAFSCNYHHVALVLKRLNGSFRSHPCLLKNKMLYSPLGKVFILQPDEKSSPSHPLLPPGSSLYAFDQSQSAFSNSALKAFLNNPHPLETLSDPTAYGSEGTILRDHDSSNYLKAVNKVLRQNTKFARKAREESNLIWPLLTSPSPHSWNHDLETTVLSNREIMSGV